MLCEQIISININDTDYKLVVEFHFEEDLNKGTGSQYGAVDYYEIEKVTQFEEWNGHEVKNDFSVFLNDNDFTNEVVEALKLIREKAKNVS